jgi:Cu(I)/Ag(I) efflux system periplasmic protein CusF
MRKATVMIAAALAFSFASVSGAQDAMVDGQVTKIDQAQGKITLRHAPIQKLDMDSMTMVFRVKDPAMLKGVKVGDKVKFEADRVDGQITVIKMQKSK